jgi:hypothetical protein
MTRPQDLPPPRRMRNLPRDERGFIVPWFVAWMNEAGEPVPVGTGKPDFRVVRPGGIRAAYMGSTCWLCGQHLSAKKTFAIGPMCLINRVSSEPPSHFDCTAYAAKVCPFLTKPRMVRNTKDLPEDRVVAGVMIERNPGVTALWTTRRFGTLKTETGMLFALGEPEALEFWAEGRPASPAEICKSVESGLPILIKAAAQDGEEGLRALEQAVARAAPLLAACQVTVLPLDLAKGSAA